MTADLAEGHSANLPKAEATELTGAWTMLLALLPALPFMRRRPVEGARRPERLLLHVGLSVAVGATHTLLMWGVRSALFPLLGWGPYDYGDMRFRFPMEYLKQAAVYVLVYGLVRFVAWLRRSRESELRASELSRQLAEARLAALKRQLEPHFLFNALNTVSAFVREDPARAETMIGHLPPGASSPPTCATRPTWRSRERRRRASRRSRRSRASPPTSSSSTSRCPASPASTSSRRWARRRFRRSSSSPRSTTTPSGPLTSRPSTTS